MRTFWVIDPHKQVLACQQLWNRPSVQVSEFKQHCLSLLGKDSHSLPGRVWIACAAQWGGDVHDMDAQRVDVAVKQGIHATLACPVFLDDTVLGVIAFFSLKKREPDADLLELMSTLGGQIGQFIERRRAEAELRETEERNRSVVEHVVEGIITIDDSGCIQTFNPAAQRLFGFMAAEVIGKNVSLLAPEPYRSEHDSYISRYLETGKGRIIGVGREVLATRKDGIVRRATWK